MTPSSPDHPMIIRTSGDSNPFLLMQSAAVDWGYSVCFKQPGRSTLRWVHTRCKDVAAASKAAQAHLGLSRDRGILNEYGMSLSYWQDFGDWVARITKDQYAARVGKNV
jgi:hypothetical protein